MHWKPLKLDYEDFLRQRGLVMLAPKDPVLMRFKSLKPKTVDEFAVWVADERRTNKDEQRQAQTGSTKDVSVSGRPCRSLSPSCLAANGVLSLLNLACYLLDRQVERLAEDFENEGGFSERLYRVRSEKRRTAR